MPLVWVPKSRPNPNPNPQINQPSSFSNPQINQASSSSNPPNQINNRKKNKNKNRKRTHKKWKPKPKFPNWVELPEDIWLLILSKLNTIHIIENVQKVCTLFRKICIQPAMFRVIDMTVPDAFMDLPYNTNVMTRYAVDRTAGQLVDIYLEYVCDDDTLAYIVDRSKNLKHLRIGHYVYISDEGLVEAVQKLPMLEEMEIIICSFSHETVEAVGRACPLLNSFSLNDVGSKRFTYRGNEEALAIAKTMPNLRRLQVIGNPMTDEGLKAILDGCPRLETLDLRACFNIDLSGALGKRCLKIKHLRRPYDSTSDYRHAACDDDHYRHAACDYDHFFDDDDFGDFYGDPDMFSDCDIDSEYDIFDDVFDDLFFGAGGFDACVHYDPF